jgi:hypothetical protein
MTVPLLATLTGNLDCRAVCDTLPIVSAGSISRYDGSSLPSLREVTGSVTISIYFEEVKVDCPKLQQVGGSLTVSYQEAGNLTLSLPALATVGSFNLLILDGSPLKVGNLSLEVPSLRTISGVARLYRYRLHKMTTMFPVQFLTALMGVTSLGYIQITDMTDQWLLCTSMLEYFTSISSNPTRAVFQRAVVLECE